MTIYAVVKTKEGGYPFQEQDMVQYSIGDAIEVEDIIMGQSSTSVYLVGNERGLNSVFFKFVEDGKLIDIYTDKRFNPYL